MHCIVCGSIMNKGFDWHYVCPSCGFEKSTLLFGAGRGVGGLETLRRQNFEILIARISRHIDIRGKSCLEVGCAEGWFLEAMSVMGADLSAIEPSDLAKIMKAKGYDVIQGFFPDAVPAGRTYDLIIFNDVFEHIPDPIPAFKQCEAHLNSGGLLIINLPSSDGFFYRLSKFLRDLGMSAPFLRMWQYGLPSPHMSYFSPSTLRAFGSRHGNLQVRDVFSLPSISATGLRERIRVSYPGFAGAFIHAGILCLLPVIRLLPQDISVTIFGKEKL